MLISTLILPILYYCSKVMFEVQMFQQNSYRVPRYLRWLKNNIKSPLRFIEILIAAVIITVAIVFDNNWLFIVLSSLLFLVPFIISYRRKSKLRLNVTDRVKRLLVIFLLVSIGVIVLAKLLSLELFAVLGLIVLSPIALIIAATLASPIEKAVGNWYINDAKKILKKYPNLLIIGITGSYGKTSTKHFLHAILSYNYNVLMTPGSFNTPMGVVRTIREHLNPMHEIFIVEMGAKQLGDIKEIVDIVHPSIGIITAVGEQHLETFKSVENIQKTKFELYEGLPTDGFAVLNYDYEKIEDYPLKETPASCYSSKEIDSDYKWKITSVDGNGTTLEVKSPKETFSIRTNILGSYNVSNIIACLIVADHLDIKNKDLLHTIKKMPAVEHRLELKKQSGGWSIIDNAFNSNPKGAKMSLEVLKSMDANQRIVVTPGMVELGEVQFQRNKEFGALIGEVCDVAIIVGKVNRAALLEGINGSKQIKVIEVDSFTEATTHFKSVIQVGDILLIENDLPDSYDNF